MPNVIYTYNVISTYMLRRVRVLVNISTIISTHYSYPSQVENNLGLDTYPASACSIIQWH